MQRRTRATKKYSYFCIRCVVCVRFGLCYVSNEHDDDMHVSTKERQKCINRFLFQFFSSSSESSHDADWRQLSFGVFFLSLSPDFKSRTPKNWLSRYASSVIHWNILCICMCVCFFYSMRQQQTNACVQILSLFPLASSEFNKPEFQLELHLKNERVNEWMKHTFDTAEYIRLYCQHIQSNSIKMVQVFAPICSIRRNAITVSLSLAQHTIWSLHCN